MLDISTYLESVRYSISLINIQVSGINFDEPIFQNGRAPNYGFQKKGTFDTNATINSELQDISLEPSALIMS